MGQRKMAITQGNTPFVFGMVVLATLLIATPVAHAACKCPKNICKHFDDCLQRTSDPNNKDTDGIRAGVKARNGQIVLAGAEACARYGPSWALNGLQHRRATEWLMASLRPVVRFAERTIWNVERVTLVSRFWRRRT